MTTSKLFQISIILTFALFIPGCMNLEKEEKPESPLEHELNVRLHEIENEDVKIVLIDSCEYIIYQHNAVSSARGYGYMSHKGNCKNPVHKCKHLDSEITQ